MTKDNSTKPRCSWFSLLFLDIQYIIVELTDPIGF